MGAGQLERLGPFFAVESPRAGGAWRSLAELVHGPALSERVTWTTASLSARAGVEVQERVGASTASLGVFARLLSPPIGARLLGVSGPSPSTLSWQAADGPIRLATDSWGPPNLQAVVDEVIAPLVERLDTEHGVSHQIGWGNAVSAVHGAARMAAQADPALGDAAAELVRELLAHPRLSGTADAGPPFVRRSCCLYYRIPGGGYCGDCVVAHASA